MKLLYSISLLTLILIPQIVSAQTCCRCQFTDSGLQYYEASNLPGQYDICRQANGRTDDGHTLINCQWRGVRCNAWRSEDLLTHVACASNENCINGKICSNGECVVPFTPTPEPPSFEPVLPRLQIPLPTLRPFTAPLRILTPEGKTFLSIDFLAQYLVALYKYLIGAASIIAGIMYVWAGFKWLTSSGNPERLGDARKKIASTTVGLILLLGSYVILYIVNPELVFFKPLRVEYVERDVLSVEESEEEETGITAPGDTACNTIESCRVLCQTPQEQWPKSTQMTIPLAQTTLIPSNITGLRAKGGERATLSMIAALQTAAQAAQNAPGGPYTIRVSSGYRAMDKQIDLVCQKIRAADQGQYNLNKIGTAIAWPGGSNHGAGKAVDVQLLKGDQELVCSGCYDTQTSSQYASTAPILADIMFQAGFVRYCKEIWHFELPSSTPCRSNSCRGNVIACP